MKSLKILFLPRWYPSRFDPMPGLFIQRQAEALAGFCEVTVLSVHPVRDDANDYEIDVFWQNGVFNVRVYYYLPSHASRFTGLLRYYIAHKRGLRLLRTFKPDIIHIHVLTRLGIIALMNNYFKRTPYVISEHWSRYFKENDSYRGFFRKISTKFIVSRSSALITVSEKLKLAMKNHGLQHEYSVVIPNAVDEKLFIVSNNPAQPLQRRIVHISCFEDKSKNIKGFLRSVKKASEVRSDFTCFMVGDGPDFTECKSYAASLGLRDIVVFAGVKKDEELVSALNTADFLVLSSRYETFGTVIIESLTCGIPVVSTEVGIAPEVINDTNGLLVPPGDDEKMAEAILVMLKNCRQYDRDRIRSQVTGKFSSETIGNQLHEVYKKIKGLE